MSDTRLNERIEQRVDGNHQILRTLDYEGNMFIKGDFEAGGDVIGKDASGNPISMKELAEKAKTGIGFIDTSATPETVAVIGTVTKDGWLVASFSNSVASNYQPVGVWIDNIIVARGHLLPANVESNDLVIFTVPIKAGQEYAGFQGPFTTQIKLYPMTYNEE